MTESLAMMVRIGDRDFTVTPAQAWHRREAEACVKAKDPAAALFHTPYGCDLNWALPWGWPEP